MVVWRLPYPLSIVSFVATLLHACQSLLIWMERYSSLIAFYSDCFGSNPPDNCTRTASNFSRSWHHISLIALVYDDCPYLSATGSAVFCPRRRCCCGETFSIRTSFDFVWQLYTELSFGDWVSTKANWPECHHFDNADDYCFWIGLWRTWVRYYSLWQRRSVTFYHLFHYCGVHFACHDSCIWKRSACL